MRLLWSGLGSPGRARGPPRGLLGPPGGSPPPGSRTRPVAGPVSLPPPPHVCLSGSHSRSHSVRVPGAAGPSRGSVRGLASRPRPGKRSGPAGPLPSPLPGPPPTPISAGPLWGGPPPELGRTHRSGPPPPPQPRPPAPRSMPGLAPIPPPARCARLRDPAALASSSPLRRMWRYTFLSPGLVQSL
ncbi:uncharacterized protein [Notamacropus eugenii]|uniref:uncharacterized protein isoform X2 n=1 Tax=Notamacropus eugenii TaxID=9315 RepID=UPI003B66CA70